MVKIYYNRVVTGAITLKQVPTAYRKAVKKMLIDNGYSDLV